MTRANELPAEANGSGDGGDRGSDNGNSAAPRAHDVEPRMYAMVIREMIRHENDVTNHRIMWLLVVQGLLANAYVGIKSGTHATNATLLGAMGILVTLSAFVMLYKSYQARGYLDFLGRQAKHGLLSETQLPLAGWPRERIAGWRNGSWRWVFLDRPGDLLEPYLFLPVLLHLLWSFALVRDELGLSTLFAVLVSALLVTITLPSVCFVWLWLQEA
jgi:hypothetical protein